MSADLKGMDGANQGVHADPSEASTMCKTESNGSIATSADSCSGEEDCDQDFRVQERSTAISEMWQDEFSDELIRERVRWLARVCRRATSVAERAEISLEPFACESVAKAEDATSASEQLADASGEPWLLARVQDILLPIMASWSVTPPGINAADSLALMEARLADARAREAEEISVEDRVETPAFAEPAGGGWYAGHVESWRQLLSEMQEALSLW